MELSRIIAERLTRNRLRESQTPDEMYCEYLETHKQGVKDVFQEIILPTLEEDGVEDKVIDRIIYLIDHHDDSKYDDVEFEAYRNYFYDKENHPRNSEEFNYAWNHHQKHNPHHWNYWVLINDVDNPQYQPLDMPFEYIIEMLCDWQSAGNHYGNTAYDWYQKNKDRMILSESTRDIVEEYIILFKED